MNPINTFQGVVHGKTIELFDDPGVPDGARIVVQLQSAEPIPATSAQIVSGSAGAWAPFPEMDEIMARVENDRNHPRPEVAL
jgi:hypothetical protein